MYSTQLSWGRASGHLQYHTDIWCTIPTGGSKDHVRGGGDLCDRLSWSTYQSDITLGWNITFQKSKYSCWNTIADTYWIDSLFKRWICSVTDCRIHYCSSYFAFNGVGLLLPYHIMERLHIYSPGPKYVNVDMSSHGIMFTRIFCLLNWMQDMPISLSHFNHTY